MRGGIKSMTDAFHKELKRAANGLDCAGSGESQHVEDYARDLELGVPWQDVWQRMVQRYGEYNDDFLDRFRPHLPQRYSDTEILNFIEANYDLRNGLGTSLRENVMIQMDEVRQP